ncbi:cysteine desulfurase-like protein [Labrys monachus]|uniref:Cysteine desulfurase family protein (TIGR01976 family) n=1 Tax=Labrys monachus TaxID=217067 RepID=A0ABU0FDJ3_9HYPH|nr:cysteine desulfurase-like protein [Labrys monachus]MDQ0392677.1 cysteine desulfurase family protein (TIGR01976 family) [Labrys monachus]
MNIDAVRAEFPALEREVGGHPCVFFDNPAGTQVSRRVLRRMEDAMIGLNANLGGLFATSIAAEAMVEEAHAAMAAFLNGEPDEIVFGQNMTTLTFAISRSIGRELAAGDEILLTRMEHDANVAPWLMLAEEKGLVVRWLDFDPASFEFDLSQLDGLVTDRLRLAAINYASNVTGTINDVAAITRRVKQAGALVYVDAVQFAPHGIVDVKALGCDFLVCSAYKFYGPHQGILWGRRDVLDRLTAYRVRPAPAEPPGKFETGTASREALAGVLGAIEHYQWVGTRFGGAEPVDRRRAQIVAGIRAIDAHEQALTAQLIEGLARIPGVAIQGLTARQAMPRRVPTVSFVHPGADPRAICEGMAREGISLWHGHNYGVEPVRRLGLLDKGGVVRIGLGQYNTGAEVDRLLAALEGWLGTNARPLARA